VLGKAKDVGEKIVKRRKRRRAFKEERKKGKNVS